MAEVAVDIETGIVRVNRIVCVQDCVAGRESACKHQSD